VNRRAFVAGLGAVLAAPLAAEAQQTAKAKPQIGFLGNADAATVAGVLDAFREGLRDVGWVERQTITIEYRWAGGRLDRIPTLINDLIRTQSDVIVVSGAPAVRAAHRATKTVPVVVAALLIDPVSAGFVSSFANPGGNITGLASQYEDIVTKQVQLLAEVIPGLSRLVMLHHDPGGGESTAPYAVGAAEKIGLKAEILEVKEASEFDRVFRTARDWHAQAVHVLPSPFFNANRRLLVNVAERYGLPALYEFREYAQDGGLMSYGVDLTVMFRRAASYVDRILKGAKPGDLPIERPTKFELVINLKTAKVLGLTIPHSLLLRADQVIE
jgi:putative tryptophan/tyrosine transport system substrate-binding protein